MPTREPTYGGSRRRTPGRAPILARGRAATRAWGRVLLLAALPIWTAACDVEFGGASLSLREPSVPSAGTTATRSDTAGPEPSAATPLPGGTQLLVTRLDPSGQALMVPAARAADGSPAPTAWPADADSTFPRRFVDAFLRPGSELPLHASGRRIGTVIPSERRLWPEPGCPPVAAGIALLLPGLEPPEHAFAFTPPDSVVRPERPSPPGSIRRLRSFAPILAENLLREAGFERAFLARRAALEPVTFADDTVPGMAATYLVNDSLAPGPPPPGASASLFFLARFAPREGYVPVWASARIYADTAGKVAYRHLGWIRLRGRRTDFVRRITADAVRIAALSTGAAGSGGVRGAAGTRVRGGLAGREPDWTEPGSCRALELLDAAATTGTAGTRAGR